MRRAGYDLSQYNSVTSARDLQDLRRALGYEQWNLHAASYGTRLAMVAVRVAPQGIRSVVLDSPLPPNRAEWFTRPADYVDILKRLSAACAAQSPCNDAFPEVERTFWRTVEDFDRAPRTRTVTVATGTSATVTADGSTLAGAVGALIEKGMHRAVPMAVYAAASRNEAALTALTQTLVNRLDANETGPGFGWGLHYTVNCFDEAPLNTPELRQQMRTAYPAVLNERQMFPDPSLCEGLHTFRASPEQTRLAESDIPTLIFTGEFDLQAHRSNGEIVKRAFKQSQLVEIPGAGHVPSLRHECTRTMIRDFYDSPLRPIDASCLRSLPPLRFITDLSGIAK
jgi:pimeloyl-ACP methyl ester carboxylesterase